VARALLALLLAASLTSAQARELREAREPQQSRERQQPPQLQQSPESVRAQELLRVIDGCVARLDPALDVGYAAIAARCPELTPALSRSPWAAWLPADWNRPNSQLTASSLTELHTLLARQSGLDPARHAAPRTATVGAVLAAVTREQAGGVSWWQRFKDWLRRVLTSRRADNDWLRRLMAELNLSNQATQLIGWGAFALVVALAAAIVISELRIAGILGGRARRTRVAGLQPGARGTASLTAIERAPLEHQPALLLELIASRLVEQQRLPPARALTAREVGRRARLPEESGRARLAELVAVSEQVRFAGEAVAVASLDSAMRSGRSLLATLDASPPSVAEAR
jgi:hypothetical protein